MLSEITANSIFSLHLRFWKLLCIVAQAMFIYYVIYSVIIKIRITNVVECEQLKLISHYNDFH